MAEELPVGKGADTEEEMMLEPPVPMGPGVMVLTPVPVGWIAVELLPVGNGADAEDGMLLEPPVPVPVGIGMEMLGVIIEAGAELLVDKTLLVDRTLEVLTPHLPKSAWHPASQWAVVLPQ